VALAGLLAADPRALLLDPASAARLVDFLGGLVGTTVVVSTQNLSVAEELGTRALLLARERPGLLFDGPASELVRDERLLVESGLAHLHVHQHGASEHAHFHVHDAD
jgi:cobalt/nickel transport system ATP-binding protein